MRRLALVVVLAASLVLAACGTDEPIAPSDTGITLRGHGHCTAGVNMWFTYEMRRLYDDDSPGGWFNAGPSQYISCGSTTGETQIGDHRVEGLERGAAYEVRLTVYVYNNGVWETYDSNDTKNGTDYDQGQTTFTESVFGGNSQCCFGTAKWRHAENQMQWLVTYSHGIGRKNAPEAGNHVLRQAGAASQSIRCRVDARVVLPDGSKNTVTTGWVRPPDNTSCSAHIDNIKATKYIGARYYIRSFLNDLKDVWIQGFPSANCTFTEYSGDHRDLLRCNKTLDNSPPAVTDP